MMKCFKSIQGAFFAVVPALFASQVANAANPWGPFAATSSYTQQFPCYDPNTAWLTGYPWVWAGLWITHGQTRNAAGQVLSRYEGVYAYNASLIDVPVDVGVITTNDTMVGRFLPFEYYEVYGVRIPTPGRSNDKQVVRYGFPVNTRAACRVRMAP